MRCGAAQCALQRGPGDDGRLLKSLSGSARYRQETVRRLRQGTETRDPEWPCLSSLAHVTCIISRHHHWVPVIYAFLHAQAALSEKAGKRHPMGMRIKPSLTLHYSFLRLHHIKWPLQDNKKLTTSFPGSRQPDNHIAILPDNQTIR